MRTMLQARWLGTTIGAAALASLATQQSPANEAIRAATGLRVLQMTSNPFAVGAAVAAATFAIDGTTSVLIAFGLHADSSAIARIRGWVRDRQQQVPPPTGSIRSLATDAVLSLGVGSGLVVARRNLRNDGPSLRSDIETALIATLFVAVVAGLMGCLAGGGLKYAEQVGLGTPARLIVDYGSDWRLWLGILAVLLAMTATRSALARQRAP